MLYLYGDSARSPLTSNVLEYLRDAIDFCVYALEADERIQAGRAHVKALREQADVDVEELESFGRTIVETIATTPKRAPDSVVVECADRMASACNEVVRSAVEGVREGLRRAMAQADADESAERDGCMNAFMLLLVPHAPPGSSAVVRRVQMRDSGDDYDASISGECAPLGLRWSFDLRFPDGHLFSKPARVDQVLAGFDVHAPTLTGWLMKEVKVQPQRIEQQRITEFVQQGSKIVVHLRDSADTGFDLEADLDTGDVTAARVVSGDDRVRGGFDVDGREAPRLVELCEQIADTLPRLMPARLVEARVGDEDVRGFDSFVRLVKQVVAQLAPMVHDIALHSLEPTELVLRRQLGNNRREEIYVSRETLRAKYEGLPAHLREHLAPLALDAPLSRSVVPPAPPSPAPRSELAPSRPPPPPKKPLMLPVVPPPAKAPDAPESPSRPNEQIEELSDAAILDASPDSGPSGHGVTPARNEALAAALKKAVVLGKAGRVEDAYREYAKVFNDAAFREHRPEHQRQALRFMVMGNLPRTSDPVSKSAPVTQASQDAHRAAMTRARGLIEQLSHPADYEIVGFCELALGDRTAASNMFKKALELEQTMNPQSELCERLKKRVSSPSA